MIFLHESRLEAKNFSKAERLEFETLSILFYLFWFWNGEVCSEHFGIWNILNLNFQIFFAAFYQKFYSQNTFKCRLISQYFFRVFKL